MSNDTDTNLVDGKYSIKDLVDLEELRALFEEFAGATGFTIGFLDHPGLNVLIAAGWRDICTKFHRGCPATMENCLKSNRHLLNNLNVPGQTVIELCDNGLIDCATPIIIRDKHIASLATGQLFLREPDIEYFKKQAARYGFDEAQYLKAVKEVPAIPEEKVRSVTAYLGKLASMISEKGYAQLEVKEKNEKLAVVIASKAASEAALKESELRLRFAQEIAHIGAWDMDLTDHTAIRSIEHDRIFGYTELLPQWTYEIFLQHVVPEDRTLVDDNFHRAIATRSNWDFECRIHRSDGQERWIWATGRHQTRTNAGCRMAGIVQDITERKETEKKMREEELKYQALFENASESIFVVDIATETIIDANKNAEILTGRTREELIGMNRILIHPHDQAEFYKQHFRHHVTNSGASSSNAVIERKDGTIVPVRISASVMEMEGRKIIVGLFEDITERMRMDELVKRGVDNLRATLDASSNGILAIDANRKVIFSNRKFSEMWRIPKAIMDTGNDKDLLAYVETQLSDPDVFLKEVRRLYNTRETISDNIYFKDGRIFERYSTLLHGEDPNSMARVWSFNDITERKWAEEALRESEQMLSATLRSMGDGLIATDAAGRITNLNTMAEDLTGWTLAQAAGHPVEDIFHIIHTDTSAFEENPVRYVLREDVVMKLVNHTMLTARDGARYQIADSCAPIHDADGGIIGAVLIFSNVTEEYKLRDSLRDSEEKFRSLFESSHEALMTLAPPAWRFTSGNQAMAEMFGAKTVNEFLTFSPWELSPELQPDGRASAEKAKEMIETAMQKGTYFSEWTHKRVNGQDFPATVLLSRVEVEGEKFLLATVTDITERKRAEQAIRQTAEIKSKFAAMVSHELRSPLTAIMLGVGLVLEEPGNLRTDHKEMLSLVRDNADRLGRLINNVLDLQKMTVGKMSFKITENDISDAIRTTARSMELMAKAKKLELLTDISPGIPPAMFDKDKIIQVITNLLSNAIAHTEKGGDCRPRG